MKALDFIIWLRAYLAANTEDTFSTGQFAEIYATAKKAKLSQSDDPLLAEADKMTTRTLYSCSGQLTDTPFEHLLGNYRAQDINPSSAMPMTYALRGYIKTVCDLIDKAAEDALRDGLAAQLKNGIPTSRNLPPRRLTFKKPAPKS